MTEAQDRYDRVVAVLRGMNVRARVVHGEHWGGVEVHQSGRRIVWADALGTWGWTAIDMESGETTSGHSMVSVNASPEDVALSIMLIYGTPEDSPGV